jgi:preprotein translocase subunit YajC
LAQSGKKKNLVEKANEMEIVILIAVFMVVSFAFLYVIRKQNKELKKVRKVSGRGGDFQE